MERATTDPKTPTPREDERWHLRCGRLYEDLRRPATAMVRRAFGRAFCDHEIEDLYGAAWLGTLRALDRRRTELDDEALRRYVITAVANQASKELRRRGRRPTAQLDQAWGVADGSPGPDERAAGREESRIARDVLGTLPPRRRAVILLRYGWGLEPREVCGLVAGLSPRAYRKEITRGVDELGAKLAQVYDGGWCASQEPALKAYASGSADAAQRRQAQRHLAHCRPCAELVGTLRTQLHELGGAVAWTAAGGALGGERFPIIARIGELPERAREALAAILGRGGGEQSADAAAGLGAAGVAKLAGAGAVPKILAACLGTGAAATACVAAGIGPAEAPEQRAAASSPRAVLERGVEHRPHAVIPASTPAPAAEPAHGATDAENPVPSAATDRAPTPVPSPAPAAEQEFGPGAAPSSDPLPPASSSAGPSPGDAASREFGP